MCVAVITGDIINSSQLNHSQREEMIKLLRTILKDITSQEVGSKAETFRGDSFQVMVPGYMHSLKYAILVRAGLRRMEFTSQNKVKQVDGRVSLGVGDVSFKTDTLGTSDGNAFRRSGRGLENLTKNYGLSVNTPWAWINEEMKVSCALVECIIGRWTKAQADIIYEYLLYQKTQRELAGKFGITQGAVSQRISVSGNVQEVKMMIQRFEKLIEKAN